MIFMPLKGYKQTKEHSLKNGLSHKGMIAWNKGKCWSEETKHKISKSKKGSPSWNKGLKGIMKPNKSSFKKGHKTWNAGKHNCYSQEVLTKMSERLKGKPSWNKGVCCSEKHKLNLSLSHKGKFIKEKHPNWKGGITKINLQIRNSFRYSEWRKEIFERDNYTCQKCRTNRGPLNVHHIIEFNNILKEQNIKNIDDALSCNYLWDLNNGITLCKRCHQQLHKKTTTPKVAGWSVFLE